MAEIADNSVVLNKECSAQDMARALLAQITVDTTNKTNQQMIGQISNVTPEVYVDEEMGEMCEYDSERLEKIDDNESTVRSEIDFLKSHMLYLSHQVTMIANYLHVPTCKCNNCSRVCRNHKNLLKKLKFNNSINMKSNDVGMVKYERSNETIANGNIGAQTSAAFEEVNSVVNDSSSAQNGPNISEWPEAFLSQIMASSALNPLSNANLSGISNLGLNLSSNDTRNRNSQNNCYTGSTCGRKSKYVAPSDKRIVAEYTNIHGATAAARKFNIPAQVASYYQRKFHSKPLPDMLPVKMSSNTPPARNIESPISASDDGDSNNGDWNGAVNSSNSNHCSSGLSDLVKQSANPAHCSGSPGFLRGRGRGRPKLIGDELDAELVDFMVQLKQADPRGHMTASQALAIARNYIMDKAPGLLEEHGGQVKLKLTWAMKLVSRITERQKEVELGLPPGAISSMSRVMTGTTAGMPPGGNFMADMLSQNFINQHVTQMMNQAMTANNTSSATPQIFNVRDLELPKHGEENDGKGEMSFEGFKQQRQQHQLQSNEAQITIKIEPDMEMQENSSVESGSHHRTNHELDLKHFVHTNAF